jgi:hypothetical protein
MVRSLAGVRVGITCREECVSTSMSASTAQTTALPSPSVATQLAASHAHVEQVTLVTVSHVRTSTNVQVALRRVIKMLPARTHQDHTHVRATVGTREMGSCVLTSTNAQPTTATVSAPMPPAPTPMARSSAVASPATAATAPL